MKRAAFHILSVSLTVEYDDGRALAPFAEEFAAFEDGRGADGPSSALAVRVVLHTGRPRFESGRRVDFLDAFPDPGRYVGVLLRRELAEALGEFHLLHASAVARNGAALLTAGPPGAGKSTLMNELVRRGFRYYADDVSPLHRLTRQVHPFPLAARRRTGAPAAGRRGEEKETVPAAALGFDPAAPPLPVAAVVALDPGTGPEKAGGAVEVFFRSADDEAAWDGLPDMGDLRRVLLDPAERRWRLEVGDSVAAAAAAGRWLQENRERLWTAYRTPFGLPDFGRTPRLTPLSAPEAARRLRREQTGGFGGELAAFPSGETPGEAWVRLAATLAGTPCYLLAVGRLEEELDLLTGLL